MIYEPLEDSFLLEEQVLKLAKGNVLDMGTGSGIQAEAAAKSKSVKSVLAADIQKSVVRHCRKNVKCRKIRFVQSNLFSRIKKQKFDTIIFNPPYLPADPKMRDITLDGGKKGFEVVEKFICRAAEFLKDGGIMLLLISSLTNKPKVEEILEKNLFEFEILSKKHIFFEDLFVYRIKKSSIAQKVSKKGIKKIRYFAHGHRGIIFTGWLRGKKVAVKSKLPKSRAEGRILNEAAWLKRLNKRGIGPKLVMSCGDFLVYNFAEGRFFQEFAEKSKKSEIIRIITDVLRQCGEMDAMGADKEEMHRPFKHIIAGKGKAVLIDFERMHAAKKPKNATQFMQYLISGKIGYTFAKKGIRFSREKIISLAKQYKAGKISIDDASRMILE